MPEEALTGGQMNQVVRVGDSVRRRVGPQTPTIHRLLEHVRRAGVTWVPEPRGYDEQGREVLSFIEGEVPHAMPDWVWSEAVLTDVARALGQWHDATVSFDRTGGVWGLPARAPDEVVCHCDFAPYNCVFREGRFAGAIDFELCAPGPRLWDLAYTGGSGPSPTGRIALPRGRATLRSPGTAPCIGGTRRGFSGTWARLRPIR